MSFEFGSGRGNLDDQHRQPANESIFSLSVRRLNKTNVVKVLEEFSGKQVVGLKASVYPRPSLSNIPER